MTLSIAILMGCEHHEHQEHEESTFTSTLPIEMDTTIVHEYVSQIHSVQHIELRTMEKGYLQKIFVDEGQFVKQGQLLFQIQPIINQAEVERARAEVSYAEIEYQNTKTLADSSIVSVNELKLAQALLEKAKAELSLAQAHLSFTEIRAPFNGIVGRFNDVRLGSLVDEGELLTTLSDNGKMWVYFNVPEVEYLDYATRPKSAEPLEVKLQLANGKIFNENGIIETIEADFNNETGNIAFRATFQNPDGILRNGETGNILMPIKVENAVLIPQKATFEILDRKYVYVIDKDKHIQSREIKTEHELKHIYQVSSGLSKDDMILVEGLRKVENGQEVSFNLVDQRQLWDELNQLHAE